MLADILIVVAVALIFGLCLKKVIASVKKGGCSECSGNCTQCHQCANLKAKK